MSEVQYINFDNGAPRLQLPASYTTEQVQNYLDREAANEVIEKLRLENVELKLQLKKVTEFINNI